MSAGFHQKVGSSYQMSDKGLAPASWMISGATRSNSE
jgi:hypothetical protein